MAKIVTVGEILVEIMTKNVNQSFLEIGELQGPYPSGAPAIFIDSAAKMGGDTAIISAVGNDDFGLINTRRLQCDGVDVSGVKAIDGMTTGTAFVTYFQDGGRQFIFHFGDSAAGNIEISSKDQETLAAAEYLHIMGCSVAASRNNEKAIRHAVAIAKSHNVKISFDPNIRPELLGDASVKHLFDEIIRSASVILTGVQELCDVTGKDIGAAVRQVRDGGCDILVVRDGSKRVDAYSDSGVHSVMPVSYGDFVDATGAGDCFDGAFVACLSNGMDVQTSTLYATTAASLSVTQKGPMQGTVTLQQVRDALKGKGGLC